MLHACQAGFETFLAKELGCASAKGAGWVRSEGAPGELCFAHYSLESETELRGESARKLAQALTDFFLASSRGESYAEPWPLLIEGGGAPGAARRAGTVSELFLELAKARLARVIKLSCPGRPEPGTRRGLFATLTGLDSLFVSRSGRFGGQRRMADDAQAPSRSYLKVEEAYAVLGHSPRSGETVVDLGAAPGGWSYSAAKRGARVIAVDNGPLKGGALHPLIEHRAEDAFRFASGRHDWLFCDLVENPDKVLELFAAWLSGGHCRRFVVNLKFGRIDPLALIRQAESLRRYCKTLKIRHLYHDREELTLVGERS